MSVFATALSKQIDGHHFDFLREQLGDDLVNGIPTVSVNTVDGDYPMPWGKAADLPADVVRGVLPSGRPFLAMRYVITQINQVGYEIFFQRYRDNRPPVTRIAFCNTTIEVPLDVEGDSKERAAECSRHWSSSDLGCGTYAIYHGNGMTKKHYALIKDILNGEPLDKTGGRYLPLYAERFVSVKSLKTGT